jgi:succinate dehydrogenase hydrophobic anchor subunit
MREVHLKILQYTTGIVILFLLAIHLVLMHLDDILKVFGRVAGDMTTWGSVSERAASTGWLVFYIVFLAVAIYHGLYGLRVIISEFSLSPAAISLLNWILTIFGIGLFAYAAYIPISAY